MQTVTESRLLADQVLLAEAKAGADGFGRLFDHYYDSILAYAYRRTGIEEVAQDLVAAVFEDMLRAIQTFEWRGIPLSAWLYRLAANKVADYYRAVYRRPEVGLDQAADLAADSPSLDRRLHQALVRSQLNQAIETLSEADRQVIDLIYFDDLSREEAAEILDCRVDNVYVRLHRALKRLKTQLLQQGSSDDTLQRLGR
jgi:RNA polymerase sigma-70 factor, ECF subfamily